MTLVWVGKRVAAAGEADKPSSGARREHCLSATTVTPTEKTCAVGVVQSSRQTDVRPAMTPTVSSDDKKKMFPPQAL